MSADDVTLQPPILAPAGGESLAVVGAYNAHGVAELHELTGLALPVSGDADRAETARRLLAAEIRRRPAAQRPFLSALFADAYAYELGTDPRTPTIED